MSTFIQERGEMNMKYCTLCKSNDVKTRHKGVRDNKKIDVLDCLNCGLVFLSSFDQVSNEFYEQSGMLNGKVDLKLYRQQSFNDDNRRANELRPKIIGKKVLDFGCGAGGFLHLVKGYCREVAGVELDKNINKTINSEGIQCYNNLLNIEGKYDVITLFHVLEHLVNPIEILEELKQFLEPNGIIVIEVPNADDALLTLYENEKFADFTYWSCHLYLYNNFTLKKLIEQAGYKMKLVKQIQRYPLSNHLYWLSKGLPGGQNHFSMLDNIILNNEYEKTLAAVGKCDTIIAEILLD